MPARSLHSSTGNLLPFERGSHQTPPWRRKAAAIANTGWCCNFSYHWGTGTQVVCEGRRKRPAGFRHIAKGHPAWVFTSSARQPCLWLLPSCCCNTKGKKTCQFGGSSRALCDHYSFLTLRSASSCFYFSHAGHTHHRAHPEVNTVDVVERFSRILVKGQDVHSWKRWTLPDYCINRTEVQAISELWNKTTLPQMWSLLNSDLLWFGFERVSRGKFLLIRELLSSSPILAIW